MNDIKNYCDNKTIAIIGNSSRILNNRFGKLIDSHDIVVRINHAPNFIKLYSGSVGIKTNIMSYGLSRLDLAKKISDKCNPLYNLFLIRCNGEIKNYSPYSFFKNPVYGTNEEYNILKSKFGTFKPSTGAVTVNYFVNNINFSKLNLFGFDFFNNASRVKKNEFGSYYFKDHNSDYEKEYINSILRESVIINY